MAKEVSEEEKKRIEEMIDSLVKRAKKASEEYMKLDQEQVDEIVKQMAMAGLEHHMELAKMAVEETGRGIYEDKITKNMFATEYIYHSIKYDKTVGVIEDNEEEGYEEIAEPIGIIAGVTPVTNPTSTTMFKSLIAAKTRNVIIFGFHPSAQKCSVAAATILRDAAIKAGAPEDCILWIEEPSITATTALMNHPGVNLILATGGSGMVKSAYSCGKPALGVGPGNVPCYIDKTAKLKTSVNDLVLSKSFDNGMICASEQSVIVDKEIHKEFEELMKEAGCYFLNAEQTEKLRNSMFIAEKGCALNADIVGKSPYIIAKGANIEVPKDTKVLVLKENGVGIEYPFSKEKLSPVLAYYVVENADEGIELAEKLIEFGGMGHSAVIHSEDNETIQKFSERVKVGRIIVNSPSTHGAIGDIYNTNMPSLTLGCGNWSDNWYEKKFIEIIPGFFASYSGPNYQLKDGDIVFSKMPENELIQKELNKKAQEKSNNKDKIANSNIQIYKAKFSDELKRNLKSDDYITFKIDYEKLDSIGLYECYYGEKDNKLCYGVSLRKRNIFGLIHISIEDLEKKYYYMENYKLDE